MIRLREAWFEFNGRRSDEMGIMLTKMPVRGMAAERGKFQKIPGRHGAVWQPEDGMDTVEVKIECYVPDGNMEEISRWLTGSGLLCISDDPEWAYEARISKSFSRSNPIPRFTMQQFAVVFTCQPFRLMYPEAAPITITENGKRLSPEGNAIAQPRVEIRGSGSFMLTIGMRTMFFTDITDGIVVDSELMDALNLTGSALLNNHVSGDFFELDPEGMNVVTWVLEDGAEISEVIITPRWRCY